MVIRIVVFNDQSLFPLRTRVFLRTLVTSLLSELYKIPLMLMSHMRTIFLLYQELQPQMSEYSPKIN